MNPVPRFCDLPREGFLRAGLVRAPFANARITSVRESSPMKGCSLLLPDALPGRNAIELPSHPGAVPMPLLAEGTALYQGQPVAIALAPSDDALEEYLASLVIEAEPLHDSFPAIVASHTISGGNNDIAFSIATSILEDAYQFDRRESYPAEPRGAMVSFDYDKLVVRCPTAWPASVRNSVAYALECQVEDVVVEPTLSDDLDADALLWYPSYLACLAASAARASGRPVLLAPSRHEDLAFGPKSPATTHTIKTGIDENGQICALHISVAIDSGAYGVFASEFVDQVTLASQGVYDMPNISVEVNAYSGSGLPASPVCGFGSASAMAAMELHASRIVQSANADPYDWKSGRIARKGPVFVAKNDIVPYESIAEKVLAASDFYRKYSCYELIRKRRGERSDGPLKGIGFAFARQGAGSFLSIKTGSNWVEATLGKDMKLEISTGLTPWNAKASELFRAAAASSMGIPDGDVVFAPNGVVDSGPAVNGRGATVIRRLVESCCDGIRKKRFRMPLPISEKALSRPRGSFEWTEHGSKGSPFESHAWAGAVVELELDEGTLEPRVTGIWLCIDAGFVRDGQASSRAVIRGCIESLSYCTRESAEWNRDPEAAANSFAMLPLTEIPPIRVDFIEHDERTAPKAMNELPSSVLPAAFLAALSQTTGIAFNTVPVQSSRMFLQFGAI